MRHEPGSISMGRRTLERLQIDGRAIWDGRSAIVARKDVGESATWIQSSGRVADIEHLDEPDNITATSRFG
jgi:hypothetical protein